MGKKSGSKADKKTTETPAALPVVGPGTAVCANGDQPETLDAAEQVFHHILGRVKQFQSELPPDHELGLHLADFGGGRALHVRGMGFKNPNIIEFYGKLDGDQQVAVIQHISQLNFLLIAVPPPADQPPYRIGFGAEL